MGDEFYRTFAGGEVNAGGINTTNSIDPFFFSSSMNPAAVPGPQSFVLLLTAAAGIGLTWRKRR